MTDSMRFRIGGLLLVLLFIALLSYIRRSRRGFWVAAGGACASLLISEPVVYVNYSTVEAAAFAVRRDAMVFSVVAGSAGAGLGIAIDAMLRLMLDRMTSWWKRLRAARSSSRQ